MMITCFILLTLVIENGLMEDSDVKSSVGIHSLLGSQEGEPDSDHYVCNEHTIYHEEQ